MVRRRVVVLLVLAVLAGCSSGRSGSPAVGDIKDAQRRDVERQADQHAKNAGVAMLKFNKLVPAGDAALHVVGTSGSTTIEALVADGTTWDGQIVLRITQRQDTQFDFAGPAIRCYRFVLRHRVQDYDPRLLDRCPDTPALVLTPPVVVTLPSNSLDRLQSTLAGLSPEQRSDAEAVRIALVAAFDGSPTDVRTATAGDGSVGVAVSAGQPGENCLAARAPRAGAPEVWVPPHVVVQPGELGCSASAFAQGYGKQSPH